MEKNTIADKASELRDKQIKITALKKEIKAIEEVTDQLKYELEEYMTNNEYTKLDISGVGLLYFRTLNKISYQKLEGLDEKKKLFNIIKEKEGGLDGFLSCVEFSSKFLGGLRDDLTNSLSPEEIVKFSLPAVKQYKVTSLLCKVKK